MSAAIIDYAHSLSIEPKPEDVEDFQNFPGEGIYGQINGKGIYIGNRRIGLRAGYETGWFLCYRRLANSYNLGQANN